MKTNDASQEIKDKLSRFFLEMASLKSPEHRNESDVDSFVFHVSECFDDFWKVCQFHEQPDRFSDKDVKQLMQETNKGDRHF